MLGQQNNNEVIARNEIRVEACNAWQTEMKVVLIGMKSVSELQTRRVKVFTYCMEVITALKNSTTCKLELVALCSEIKSMVGIFDSCTIVKCNRDRIRNSHELDTEARKYG